MVMGVAANVAGAARAGADFVQRRLHRFDDGRMLAHAEVIVGAPDGDRLGAVVAGEALRVGVGALGAQDVDEDAIAAFVVQPVDRRLEDLVVVHVFPAGPGSRPHYRRPAAFAIANDSQNLRS